MSEKDETKNVRKRSDIGHTKKILLSPLDPIGYGLYYSKKLSAKLNEMIRSHYPPGVEEFVLYTNNRGKLKIEPLVGSAKTEFGKHEFIGTMEDCLKQKETIEEAGREFDSAFEVSE